MQYKYTDHDENILFLIERVRDIRMALFKSQINAELQLPNNIIQTLRADEEGNIWFLTSCNGDYAKSIQRSFSAELDYYRKGTECRLQLNGKATIVEDEDEQEEFLSISNYSKGTAGRLVLIKFKILQAEYFENKTEKENFSWKERVRVAFTHLFLTPSHRVYDFS